MKTRTTLALIGLVALLASSGTVTAQVDFTKYVALGDSYGAGYTNNSLVDGHQRNGYVTILARQIGAADFQIPSVSEPGIPAELVLKQLQVVNGSIVPTIQPKSASNGSPTNATLARPYNNLCIPGAKTNDLLTKTGDITKLLTGNIDQNTLMYDLILRDKTNEAYKQAIGLQGSFYTVWIGGNDLLTGVLVGTVVDGVTLTPKAAFQTQYTTLLGAIRAQRPNAAIVVANFSDLSYLPFVSTVKPYVMTGTGQKLYLYGENGQLTDADFVTLQASALIQAGYGLSPAKPLPEGSIDATGLHAGVILRAAEVALVRSRAAELNAVVTAVAAQFNAKVVDVDALWKRVAAGAYVIGGVRVTPAFLTGGFMGYDGFHPTELGAAIVANEFVRTINAAYGTAVPEVNLRPFVLGTQAATAELAGEVVFSLDAYKSMLRVMVPEALTDALEPQPTVRRRLASHTPERLAGDEPQP